MKDMPRDEFIAKAAAVREARKNYLSRYRDADAHIKDNCRKVSRSCRRQTHSRTSCDRLEG